MNIIFISSFQLERIRSVELWETVLMQHLQLLIQSLKLGLHIIICKSFKIDYPFFHKNDKNKIIVLTGPTESCKQTWHVKRLEFFKLVLELKTDLMGQISIGSSAWE